MTIQPRRARKVDANQAAIVAALRAIPGVQVLVLNAEVDLIVGHRGRNYLLEVKRDHRPSRLKPSQEAMRITWPGQYAIVSTLDEALAVTGIGGNGNGETEKPSSSRKRDRQMDTGGEPGKGKEGRRRP
jgi:hemin uptake protein HemP